MRPRGGGDEAARGVRDSGTQQHPACCAVTLVCVGNRLASCSPLPLP